MSDNLLSLAIFTAPNREGDQLASLLLARLHVLAAQVGLMLDKPHTVRGGAQYDFFQAMLGCDLIIFDASLDPGEPGELGANFAAATANPIADDRILVVSRSRLPLNYIPMRSNVPRLGDEIRESCPNGRWRRKTTWSNAEILEWVETEIREMLGERRIPKASKDKLLVPPQDRVATASSAISTVMERNQRNSLEYMKARRRARPQAFISYRTRYAHENCNGWTAPALADHIRRFHGDSSFKVIFFADGEISSECLTEQRRWGLASFLDRRLREMDEIWLFNTPTVLPGGENADGYLDSWWTQVEILSLMYIQARSLEDLPKRIYVFDPFTGLAVEHGPDFLPPLPEDLAREIARYHSASDEVTGGDEGVLNMRRLRSLPEYAFKIAFEKMKAMQLRLHAPETAMWKMANSLTCEGYLESVRSRVYDPSFMETHVVDCPRCRPKNVSLAGFYRREFLEDVIRTSSDSPQGRAHLASLGRYGLSPEEFNACVRAERWSCPHCGTPFSLLPGPKPGPTRWWPIRMGKPTGPGGRLIEEVPTWRIVPL